MTFKVPSNPKHSVTHDRHWPGGVPSGPTASCADASQNQLPLTCPLLAQRSVLLSQRQVATPSDLRNLGTGLENEDQSKNAVLNLARSGLLCHLASGPFSPVVLSALVSLQEPFPLPFPSLGSRKSLKHTGHS